MVRRPEGPSCACTLVDLAEGHPSFKNCSDSRSLCQHCNIIAADLRSANPSWVFVVFFRLRYQPRCPEKHVARCGGEQLLRFWSSAEFVAFTVSPHSATQLPDFCWFRCTQTNSAHETTNNNLASFSKFSNFIWIPLHRCTASWCRLTA